MSELLSATVSHLNRLRRRAYLGVAAIRFARATFLAGTMLGIWSFIRPEDRLGQAILTLLTFLVGMSFNSKRHSKPIRDEDILLALEMAHPATRHSPFALRDEPIAPQVAEEWQPLLEEEIKSFKKFEIKRLTRLLSTLPLPLLAFLATTGPSTGAIRTAITNVSQAVAQLSQGATLTVLEGVPDGKKMAPLKLTGGRTSEIELMQDNLIEIKVVGQEGEVPLVELKKRIPGKEIGDPTTHAFQSFQLAPVRDPSLAPGAGVYALSFAVADDVEVYLSTASRNVPVSVIKVKQLPVPKVRLEVDDELRQPWSDDKPLPLRIDVTADNPLELVRLQIRSGGRTYTEIVNNILANDLKELSSSYSLILESYVESDHAEVELIAEAVDRSLPTPLTGQSSPLVIQTVSAYGRYRETLQTLKEVKGLADEMAKNQRPLEIKKARELSEKALKQSEDSPFFDGLDRVYLNRFNLQLAGLSREFKLEELLDVSRGLDDFLFEHEVLDDRERDRDFFVAARTLSRLLEKPTEKRAVSVSAMTARLKTFLNERHTRWELRVERLEPNFVPKLWSRVRQKPFHKAMDNIERSDAQNESQKSLATLSSTVALYKEWLEDLEAKEDEARKAMEQKRQQGLANAQNTLREMQRRQGQIASRLDKAAERPKEEIANQWPATRMDQNANIEAAQQLEAQLRSLSQLAGERVKAALEAMGHTVTSGNSENFVEAESAADLAGRLLRQAESAAQRSQQQKERRGRRRRVTGDNYYGSQIAGGDIEIRREYEVNRRYREDILEDVRQSKNSGDAEDEQLLENYLRRVIR